MALFRGLGFRKDASRGTQPTEHRKVMAGLVAPASTFGARQGIMVGPGNPLRVTGTGAWTYSVAAGHVVTSRSDGDGAAVFGNDGTFTTSAVAAAPGTGSRWDLIYIRHQNVDVAGETSDATIGVVSGTASGTPTKPTASLPAGAVVLAEAQVSAGATSTSHANVTITNVLPFTVARGAAVPVPSKAARDALTQYNGLEVYRLDTGAFEVSNGTAWGFSGGRTPRVWAFPRVGDSAAIAGGSFIGVVSGTITDAPAGDYELTGVAVIRSTGVVAGGLFRITANGATVIDATHDAPAAGTARNADPVSYPYTHTGGDLALIGYTNVGAAYDLTAAGSYISAKYLGAR